MADEKETKTEAQQTTKPQKKWKTVLGWILTVVFAVVLLFCIVVVVQAKTAKKPFLFGYATYFVVSGSMEPTIHVKDVILIKEVKDPSELKKGDVITYQGREGEFRGKVVTHRIISDGVVNGKITTCGDANHGIADPAITYDDVIGKYVKTSAFLTTVYMVFTSKYGFLFIVFIPLIIILIVQIVNFRRACKMDKDGKMPEEKTEEEIKQATVKEKEEELRRKAVEEYLESKKKLEQIDKLHKK